jgi:protein phosphatase
VEERLALAADPLPPCRTVPDDAGLWVFCDARRDRYRRWEQALPAHPLQRLKSWLTPVRALAHALEALHRTGHVWLNFDPAEIEELPAPAGAEPRRLRFTNLDVRLFRRGACPASLGFNGKYAAPEVAGFHASDIGPATDVYHLAAFTYYALAGLLPHGLAGSGLEAIGHRLPPLRLFAPELPEGVAPVVARGLDADPARRYPTPAEFVAALADATRRAEDRRRWTGTVAWDAGGASEAGRSKTAVGRANEDHLRLRPFAAPPALLAAVADGISTCDVGTGALASLITTMVVEDLFDAGSSHDDFPARIGEACRASATRLLDWAIEKGYGDQLARGSDLMGTTLTAGWLEGRDLSLANLGDSRAYLVTDGWCEQLTVDADLASDLLLGGMPPEQVRELGVTGRALRACVGGCVPADGTVRILEESCHPVVSFWPLLPGDVVVLCTDGLVDEGYFLEPEAMAEIVRANRALPAADIARRLVEAADALQRLPSELDPEGFGDNVTCVVIKIESADDAEPRGAIPAS